VRRSALLIGTGRYDDSRLPALQAPASDVVALGDALRRGGFDSVEVFLDRDEPTVRRAIANATADTSPDDLLVIYVSCHGLVDVAGSLYFAASDTRTDRLSSTAVSAAFLNAELERSPADGKVLILDCCFSGAFASGLRPKSSTTDILAGRLGSGYAVLAASAELEYAFEHELDRTSLFTSALVDGLTTGAADLDADGWVSAEELFHYAETNLPETHSQHPRYSAAQVSGKLLLCPVPSHGDISIQVRRPAHVPRTDDVRQVIAAMREGNRAVALIGSPGNGKTQLARMVVDALMIDRSATIWLNVESVSALARDMAAELARRGRGDQPELNAIGHVLGGLLASLPAHGVVVLDNADDWTVIDEVLPSQIPAMMLITSRREPLRRDDLTVVRVGPMTVTQGAALAAQLLPSSQQGDAWQLSQALGGWPLAITQSCALIRDSGGLTVSELCADLGDHAAILLEEGHERALTDIYRRTITELMANDHRAGTLLSLAALVAPSEIPGELLREALASLEPGYAGQLQYSRGVAELARRCLVTVEADHLSIHPLSQSLLRALCPDKVAAARSLLPPIYRRLSAGYVDGMLVREGLAIIPHALQALRAFPAGARDHLYDVDGGPVAVAALVRGLIQAGDSTRALDVLHDLGVLGADHRLNDSVEDELLLAVLTAGEALRFVDRNSVAISNYHSILDRPGLPADLRVRALVGLGGTLKMFQRYPEAGTCLREALALMHNDAAAGPLVLGQCLFALGNVQFGTSQWDEATESYQRALAAFARVNRESPLGMRGQVDCLKGLMDLAIKRGDIGQARQYIDQATELRNMANWFRDLHTDSKLAQGRGDVLRMELFKAGGPPDPRGMEACLVAYQQAHDLYRTARSPLGQALSLYRIACVKGLHDPLQAHDSLQEAAEIFEHKAHNRLGALKCQLLAIKLNLAAAVLDDDAVDVQRLALGFRDECGSPYWYADAMLTGYVLGVSRGLPDADTRAMLADAEMVTEKLHRPDKDDMHRLGAVAG